jgi:hypothetical protein
MSYCRWSSVLERQQGINLALCASALLDEFISESSGNEDSSLSEGNSSNSSSSDSTLSSVSGSSGTRSEMSEVNSVDSASIIDNLLGVVAQVHDQTEIGMEDNTIQWGNRLHIQDLSEDDALTHFCFRKVHLQEVADKLWPRLQCFLTGHRGSIKVNNGTYFLPYENLLLLVLYSLSRPRCIRKEMEGFFGIHMSKYQLGLHV